MKKIAVLCGGKSSSEREISLRSGDAVYRALREKCSENNYFIVEKFELIEDAVPTEITAAEYIVFPICHGEWGEDGQLQKILEQRGISFAGSGSRASALGMNKFRTEQLATSLSIPNAHGLLYSGQAYDEIVKACGKVFIVKPNDKGSSVSVHKVYSEAEFLQLEMELKSGQWLIEKCFVGRELTVGIINGRALPVVEICPKVGFYDYNNKYTPGASEYFYPANIDEKIAIRLQKDTEKLFTAGEFRDFARVDYLLLEDGQGVMLEINTSPGMTATSLLPKAASVLDIGFPELCWQLVTPAIARDIQ